MNNNHCQKQGNFWFGFFLGGLVGAFIIFVLGTKEGKKLAEKLLEKTEIFEEEIEEKITHLQKQGEELLSETQEMKEKVAKDLANGKTVVSETLASKMDQALSKIEDLQRKGVEITSEVRHRHFRKNGKPLVS